MKLIITGPRSSGKSTVGKILAEEIKLRYISSDDKMDIILQEHGGINGATKAGKMDLIIDEAKKFVKKTLNENEFVLDLAGGALRKKYYGELLKDIKQKTKVIGLIPSLNDEKTGKILYERERKRTHFDNLTDEELFAKTKKDYLKIKETLQTVPDVQIITENKQPKEIVKEIRTKLKLLKIY